MEGRSASLALLAAACAGTTFPERAIAALELPATDGDPAERPKGAEGSISSAAHSARSVKEGMYWTWAERNVLRRCECAASKIR